MAKKRNAGAKRPTKSGQLKHRRGMYVDKGGRLRNKAGRLIAATTRHRKQIIRRAGWETGKPRKATRADRPSSEFEKFKASHVEQIKSRREKMRAYKRAERDPSMGFIPRPKPDKKFTDATIDAVLKTGRKRKQISRVEEFEEFEGTKTIHTRHKFDPTRFKKHLKTWLKREKKRAGKKATVVFTVTMKGRKKDGTVVEVKRSTGGAKQLTPDNYSSFLGGVSDVFVSKYGDEIEFFEVADIEGTVIDEMDDE